MFLGSKPVSLVLPPQQQETTHPLLGQPHHRPEGIRTSNLICLQLGIYALQAESRGRVSHASGGGCRSALLKPTFLEFSEREPHAVFCAGFSTPPAPHSPRTAAQSSAENAACPYSPHRTKRSDKLIF